MLFTTDSQTIRDLNILGRRSDATVYTLFNHTATRGGANLLEEMFRYPLSDEESINNRSRKIQYLSKVNAFPFDSQLLDIIEQYLDNTDERTALAEHENSLVKKLSNAILDDPNYKSIYQGITGLIGIINTFRDFIAKHSTEATSPLQAEMESLTTILDDEALMGMIHENSHGKIPLPRIAAYDQLVRFRKREGIKKLLLHIYYIDVYIAVGRIAVERQFAFPLALPKEEQKVTIVGVYHPQLSKAVPNDVDFSPDKNIVFLTGANMAGKSTFMKSLGIAMYLAHMGFPVAATKMEFSVLDGMYTTINLPDNLGMGASHFYAEVLRLKKVAKELSLSKSLFIMFDELFRGTNVKDAQEATVAIVDAFASKRSSMFVISTHIIEAGEVLKNSCNNISFKYLPTRLNENSPEYTYQLEDGITADRHGMIIINNAGIIEILKRRNGR